MRHEIYTIKDELTGFNENLFMQRNEAEAIRTFADVVNTDGSVLNKNPKDYSLYLVGYFETETGKIVNDSVEPRKIIDANSVFREE